MAYCLLISAKSLRNFIQNTPFATTTENSRFTLAGAKLTAASGRAAVITTDGHQPAHLRHEADTVKSSDNFQLDAFIPKKYVMKVAKILKDKGDELTVTISEDLHHLFFESSTAIFRRGRMSSRR